MSKINKQYLKVIENNETKINFQTKPQTRSDAKIKKIIKHDDTINSDSEEEQLPIKEPIKQPTINQPIIQRAAAVPINQHAYITPENNEIMVTNLKKEIKIIRGFSKQATDDVRKTRGMHQRIFLILTHEYDDTEHERKYEVMGTTGNVYTVCIVNVPTCTCPDYMTRNKRCKHIYFVLTRIMKVKVAQEDIEEYSDDDLEDMFSHIPQVTENLRVDAVKLAKFKSLKKNDNGEVDMRKIDEEHLCPICLGEVYGCNEKVIYCRYSCGNPLHEQCFQMYNSKQTECKCIFCQKPWEDEKKQYINIE